MVKRGNPSDAAPPTVLAIAKPVDAERFRPTIPGAFGPKKYGSAIALLVKPKYRPSMARKHRLSRCLTNSLFFGRYRGWLFCCWSSEPKISSTFVMLRRFSRAGTSGGIGIGGMAFELNVVSASGFVRRASCCFSCTCTMAFSRSLTFSMYSNRFWMYSSGCVIERDIGIMSEYCGILLRGFFEAIDGISAVPEDDATESGVWRFVFG